jgi:hypothetical protein
MDAELYQSGHIVSQNVLFVHIINANGLPKRHFTPFGEE